MFQVPFLQINGEKKDKAGTDAAKKGDGSDSDDDAQEAQQKKEGGVSNKQKKVCSSVSDCLLLHRIRDYVVCSLPT